MENSIPGLLPGCELVRFGSCGADEFEQFGDHLLKGSRGGSQIIVNPAPGYKFIFDIENNCYRPVKVFTQPKTFNLDFTATSDDDMKTLELIRKLPGVGTIADTTPPPPEPPAEPEAGGA